MTNEIPCPLPPPPPNRVKIPWGVNLVGHLVHVSHAKNGRSCQLGCPECATALEAKQGAVRQWHLAHVSTTWCTGGLESAAHRRAIEILVEHKLVWLPAPDDQSQGFIANFERAADEVPLPMPNPRRADVVFYAGDRRLAVEVCVSHAVDSEKEADLRTWPHPSIEIFIDPMIALDSSEDAFIEHVLHSARRRWIYQAKWFLGTDEGCEAALARQIRENAIAAKRRQEATLRKERAYWLNPLFKPELYAATGPIAATPYFLQGLAAIQVLDPELHGVLSQNLRAGTRVRPFVSEDHSFTLTCEELSAWLGTPVEGLVRQLGIEFLGPWGAYKGVRPFSKELSPQSIIAVWAALHSKAMRKAPWEKLVLLLRSELRPTPGNPRRVLADRLSRLDSLLPMPSTKRPAPPGGHKNPQKPVRL